MVLNNCPDCKTELTQEMFEVNMCFECGYIIDKNLFDDTISDDTLSNYEIIQSIVIHQVSEKNEINEKIARHILTSGYNFEGFRILKYINVIRGQVIIGTGLISELKASASDILGIESNTLANKLEKAKQSALKKMLSKSISIGGNAIIGIDFDYITFSNNMIGVSANGTSVLIEKDTKNYGAV